MKSQNRVVTITWNHTNMWQCNT